MTCSKTSHWPPGARNEYRSLQVLSGFGTEQRTLKVVIVSTVDGCRPQETMTEVSSAPQAEYWGKVTVSRHRRSQNGKGPGQDILRMIVEISSSPAFFK